MKADTITRKVTLTELQARAIELSSLTIKKYIDEADELRRKAQELEELVSRESDLTINAINKELKGTKLPLDGRVRLIREDNKPPRVEWEEQKKQRSSKSKKSSTKASQNGTTADQNEKAKEAA